MSAHILQVQEKLSTGTGVARALRRDALVPAVIYGGTSEPEMIAIDEKSFIKEIHTPGILSRIFILKDSSKEQQAIVKDIQFHPVTDRPLHVDFQRVDKNSQIKVYVALHFSGQDKSPALKRGATLNVVQHKLEILCNPKSIPESINVDLSTLALGENITLDNVELPADVKVCNAKRDYVVATLVGGKKDKEEAS